MNREPSWEAVAGALADRMFFHSNCETHPENDPDPSCPFCKDRAAYQVWQRKSGLRHVERIPDGERSVSIEDVRRGDW